MPGDSARCRVDLNDTGIGEPVECGEPMPCAEHATPTQDEAVEEKSDEQCSCGGSMKAHQRGWHDKGTYGS